MGVQSAPKRKPAGKPVAVKPGAASSKAAATKVKHKAKAKPGARHAGESKAGGNQKNMNKPQVGKRPMRVDAKREVEVDVLDRHKLDLPYTVSSCDGASKVNLINPASDDFTTNDASQSLDDAFAKQAVAETSAATANHSGKLHKRRNGTI